MQALRYYSAYSLCLKAAAAGNRAVSVMTRKALPASPCEPAAVLRPTSGVGSTNITREEILLLNLPPEDVLALATAGELMRAVRLEGEHDAYNSWIPEDNSDMEEDDSGSTWI